MCTDPYGQIGVIYWCLAGFDELRVACQGRLASPDVNGLALSRSACWRLCVDCPRLPVPILFLIPEGKEDEEDEDPIFEYTKSEAN